VSGPVEVPAGDRLERTARLLGLEAMGRLRAARVYVFGLGGVGSFCAEALTRCGVGHIRIVDHDVVSASNCNRQVQALGSTLGRPKVEALGERLRDIDPGVNVEALQAFFATESAGELLEPAPDWVVDAVDALGPKVELLHQCVRRGICVLSALGAAARLDPTRVRVGPLARTHADPFGKRVRKALRKRCSIEGVVAVWSDEPPRAAAPGPWPAMTTDLFRGRQRVIQPSMACVPAAAGLAAASEVVARIAGLKG
jgi:tRNA A37 threonylcarbamoyladenosine dehydratase